MFQAELVYLTRSDRTVGILMTISRGRTWYRSQHRYLAMPGVLPSFPVGYNAEEIPRAMPQLKIVGPDFPSRILKRSMSHRRLFAYRVRKREQKMIESPHARIFSMTKKRQKKFNSSTLLCRRFHRLESAVTLAFGMPASLELSGSEKSFIKLWLHQSIRISDEFSPDRVAAFS